ncbi:MAG: hypothetical protein J6C33_06215, partial [Lachnospiraceae bacterium]|nr:hypothetical protein [Lachnospiraceae bacterium]
RLETLNTSLLQTNTTNKSSEMKEKKKENDDHNEEVCILDQDISSRQSVRRYGTIAEDQPDV